MTVYIYETGPVDHWFGWTHIDDVKWAFVEDFADNLRVPFTEFARFFEIAKRGAIVLGWDGDVKQGPFISALPPDHGDPTSDVIVGWKQWNNGTTFIASPRPLLWLQDEDVSNVQVET